MKKQFKLQNGKWLLNNRAYEDCTPKEKQLFNQFILYMKLKRQKNRGIKRNSPIVPNLFSKYIYLSKTHKIKR